MSYDYGEHLCQVISKSLHKWLSYGPGTKCWTDRQTMEPISMSHFYLREGRGQKHYQLLYHDIRLSHNLSQIIYNYICSILLSFCSDMINIIISDIADLSVAFTLNTGKSLKKDKTRMIFFVFKRYEINFREIQ